MHGKDRGEFLYLYTFSACFCLFVFLSNCVGVSFINKRCRELHNYIGYTWNNKVTQKSCTIEFAHAVYE